MPVLVVTTRHAPAHAGCPLRSTVTPELDRKMSVAPSIALRQGERGHGPRDLVKGVRSAGRTPCNEGMAT
jgi:hypothetical protein